MGPRVSFSHQPYAYGEARALADALDLAEPVAITLVRRGYRTPEQAREFLEGSEAHDRLEFSSMSEIAWRLRRACEKGTRITVHGDYDVDGVCSTAILVRVLRELGAENADWLIPDRASDGYGLTLRTVEALAERGTEMILTADCGIACAEEVEAAKAAGIEVIVTDHHQPPERLPDCPILHPVLSGYPFTELCATAVAHKLSEALRSDAGLEPCLADRQLVALATVADMVPLVGENRRLVREGLAEARRGACLGLRALIAVSHTDATRLDAGDLGFRIAPRINAAGRLYRADAGVELMLTEDGARASQIAAELDRANYERRTVEREALDAAELALAKLDPGQRDAPGIVLAGQGWHPGVIGIVASRLVERHAKPVVLIAIDGKTGRGSGRGIPDFDLVAGLAACEKHLTRFGGHAAAAGLEIEADAVEEFRQAFLAHTRQLIDPESLVRSERIDAFAGVGTDGIGIELAEQFERLGPFGSGNPEPRLLVPAARVREVRAMGESGDHARFQLESGSGRAQGVAFNAAAEVRALEGGRADLAVRLEVDRWNGAVQPRVVLGHSHRLPDPEERPGPESHVPAPEWWRRFEAELSGPLDWPPAELREAVDAARAGSERQLVDRRGGATLAAIAELTSSGERVLALCADAARRRGLVEMAGFGGELELADWATIARAPAALQRFEHLVLVEPAPFEHLDRIVAAAAGREGEEGTTPLRRGHLHLAWGDAELDLAERLLEREWSLRPQISELYRALSAAGGAEGPGGDALMAALDGGGPYPRTPELAARCARVLVELGLCSWAPGGAGGTLRVVSSEETKLEQSEAYTAYLARHEEGAQYLRRQRQLREDLTLPAAA